MVIPLTLLPYVITHEFKHNQLFEAWNEWRNNIENVSKPNSKKKTIQEKIEEQAKDEQTKIQMSLKLAVHKFKDLIDYKFFFVGDENRCINYDGEIMRHIAREHMVGDNHLLVDDEIFVLKLITKDRFDYPETIFRNENVHGKRPEKIMIPIIVDKEPCGEFKWENFSI